MQLGSLIPPKLLEISRRWRAPVPAFGSYEEAAARCGDGYSADDLARVVVAKTERYRDSLRSARPEISDLRGASVATAIGLASAGRRLRCLDFGGAAGAHFFLAKHLFGERIELEWHVVETSRMVRAAAALSGEGLQFHESLESASKAGPIDLLFSSGAVQCVPNPEQTVRQLVSIGARHLFFTRIALADEALSRRVIVQRSLLSENGIGPLPEGFIDRPVFYPATFAARAEIEQIIAERYAIEITFREEREAYRIERTIVPMFGFFGSVKP